MMRQKSSSFHLSTSFSSCSRAPPFGFLMAPIEAVLENLADMVAVVANPKMAFDETGHESRSTVRWANRGPWRLGGAGFQGKQLLVAETGGASRVWFGIETFEGSQSAPPMDVSMDAEDASDEGGGLSLRQQLHSASSPPLQLFRTS